MSHLLKAKCVRRHPPADRTESGNSKVEAMLEFDMEGVVGTIYLTVTDPLIGCYLQVGKHYEIPLQLEQHVAMSKESETA